MWVEGDLLVPAGVTIQGAGRGSTIVDAAASTSPLTGLTLGDGAAATDLQVRPDEALGMGVEFLGAGSVERLEVRGGLVGLVATPGNGALIQVQSTLVALGTSGLLGIDGWNAQWELDRVTLFQEPGGVGTAFSATAAAGVEVGHALVVGWDRGLHSGPAPCEVLRSMFWEQASDAWDDCELLPGLPTLTDLDPLFVSPGAAIDGDFHLASTAGQWAGTAFAPGVEDSPGLDAAHDGDSSTAEADGACNLPNLGAYGGTSEASRGPFADCPFTNVDTGQASRP